MKLKKLLNRIHELLGNKRAEVWFPKKKIQIEVTQSEYAKSELKYVVFEISKAIS